MASNDIDALMDKLSTKYNAVLDKEVTDLVGPDIDIVIAYQRQARANAEAGIKPKKDSGPKQSISLEKLGLAKPKPPMTRRV